MQTLLKTGMLGLTVASFVAAAAPPAAAQTPIRELATGGSVTIDGRVTDVFGNKFVLEGDSGRTLVETGPDWYQRLDVRSGQELTVVGRPGPSGGFDAFRIVYPDGREVTIRDSRGPARVGATTPPPPPGAGAPPPRRGALAPDRSWAQLDEAELRRIVEAAGYRWGGDVDRGPRHYEVEAFDRDGNEVEVHVDVSGAITNVHMAEPAYDVSGLRRIVEEAGYRWDGDVERHPRHFEVDAINPYGEEVELHVDFTGAIYEERIDR